DASRARLEALVEEAEAALAPFGARALTLKQAARFIASRRA
ncbi:MAG: polyprenyl synthetase family protein, partial [Methyloceanibacter sp.]